MPKRNKMMISVFLIVLALLLGFGIFAVINYLSRLSETGFRNTIPYGFGKEAKVIILAGQSNAVGCSSSDYLKKNITPEEYTKYEKGFDNIYIYDYATTMQEYGGFVKYKAGQGAPEGFFGPELGLAEKLNELYPDETFFIIKYAWNGTDLCNLWRSPSSGGETGQLYTGFIQHVKDSLRFLAVKNYDIKIEAICWMQGEADAMAEATALEYKSNLSNFISDTRSEIENYASQDGIAFIDAYISDSWDHYETVNAAKKEIGDSLPMITVIDTVFHGLTVNKEPAGEPDTAHYDSLSEIKLGHLFAAECAKFFD